MWIGPKQRAPVAQAPELFLVLWMVCALAERQRRGGGTVGHMGGGGGRPRP